MPMTLKLGNTTTKPLLLTRALFFQSPVYFNPHQAPYLYLFLKLRINPSSFHLSFPVQDPWYHQSGSFEKQFSIRRPRKRAVREELPESGSLYGRTGKYPDSEHYQCGEWTFPHSFFGGAASDGVCVLGCYTTIRRCNFATSSNPLRF
jgi:hypothetical protein